MSDLSYGVTVRVSKGLLKSNVSVSGVTANMQNTGLISQTLTLSTNAVSIQTAQLSQAGLAFLQNLSTATSQTATIGIDEGGSFVGLATLRAGEPAVFRMAAGTTYKAIGVAGTRLRVDVTEG